MYMQYLLGVFCLAEKFGSDNVWRQWVDEDFGKKSLANE